MRSPIWPRGTKPTITAAILLGAATVIAQPAKRPFPLADLLPKQEIGVARFLTDHPDYDGRGVVVAVLDTGVDPGAPGLQRTSDGKPKVIDMIDATGSGDVDMTETRSPDGNYLEGLSGRRLRMRAAWLKPGRSFHVGLKRGFDLFSGGTVKRIGEQRRVAFERRHNKIEAELRRQLITWDQDNPQPPNAKRREREEIVTRLEQLQAAMNDYDDPGPLYDCVVFHDGHVWRAVIDSDEDGDMTDESPLTNFRREQRYGEFGGESQVRFAVNLYNEGRRLSIVTDCGAHGTHVASIAAGYFADQPERNGVAPGAQIVSVKIGDTRLGGLETNRGLLRGLHAILANHCDVANMSYGEPTTAPDQGAIVNQIQNLVDEHRVVFVAAAGNDGPALSTVIAPGGTTSGVLGIGAYVSPALVSAAYAGAANVPENVYTWSSRGPAADGSLGVDFIAPGGAVAAVPGSTLRPHMRMNGTSMASPSASGAVALLVSAAKAEGIRYSTTSIRCAIANTARSVQGLDPLAQGAGLLQVDRAWDYLRRHADTADRLYRFKVQVDGDSATRGIYLRPPHPLRAQYRFSVRVTPHFPLSASAEEKTAFELPLALQASDSWINVGKHLLLTSGGEGFEVHVDTRELPVGVHVARVSARDATGGDHGTVFEVPITVIIPSPTIADRESEARRFRAEVTLTTGQTSRQFLPVPTHATWATIHIRRLDNGPTRLFVFHAVQSCDDQTYSANQWKQYRRLPADESYEAAFAVRGGALLELCVAQDWSNVGGSRLECQLEFHGIDPNCESVTVTDNIDIVRLDLANRLTKETLSPRAMLDTQRRLLVPIKTDLRPLDPSRDRLPDGQPLYELFSEYRFQLDKPSRVSIGFPEIDRLLYESPLGGMFWMIYDTAGRRVAAGATSTSPVSLDPGQHTLNLQLLAESPAELKPFESLLMELDRPLGKSLTLPVYASRADAVQRRPAFAQRSLENGATAAIYLRRPPASELEFLPSNTDWLIGRLHLGKETRDGGGPGQRPGGYHLAVQRRKAAQPAAASDKPVENEPPDIRQRLENERHDFRVDQLRSLVAIKPDPDDGGSLAFDRLAAELLKENPGDLDVLVIQLERLDDARWRKDDLPRVVEAADRVLARINRGQLRSHFGSRINLDDVGAKKRNEERTRQRDILVDTLYRKGRALGYMELPDVIAKQPIADPKGHDRAFEANFAELSRWVDTTDPKYFLLHVRRERRKERFGTALKILNQHISDLPPDYWHDKKRADIYQSLQWEPWAELEKKWLILRFPKHPEPF